MPVVIAVGKDHFADWIKFAGGMSVKLVCEREALDAWWHGIRGAHAAAVVGSHPTVCEILRESFLGELSAGTRRARTGGWKTRLIRRARDEAWQ